MVRRAGTADRSGTMSSELSAPIGILDEHPEWSARLIAELERRRLPFEKIDHSSHGYDPRDRRRRYAVVVNRTSPSSHRRGHAGVLFYAEPLLQHYESLGIPVINPVAAYRFEKSKALQVNLFERLRLPVLVKPNVGGSGALIERFDSRVDLETAAERLDFGPDGTALLQEYVEPAGGAIVRVEVLDRRLLYAIRIVPGPTAFNLCPADICQAEPAPAAGALGACPADATPGLTVTRGDAPPAVVDAVLALTRAASIDVGGVEYLVGKADGRVYFYDVNATSNFVANAPAVVGFDPTPRFVDYIVRVATRGTRRVAA